MYKAILKKYWKLLLSMAVVAALGTGIFTGLSGAYVSLDTSLKKYLNEYNYPDAYVTTEVVSRDRIDDILAIDGVESVDARLAADTVLISPSNRYLSIRAFSFRDDDLQKFHYWQTVETGEADAILMDREFAEENGMRAGDYVRVRVKEEYRSCLISGIVSIPEDLAMAPNNYVSSFNSDFGYVYVPSSLLEKEASPEYDDAKTELEEKEEELNSAKEEAESTYLDALEQIEKSESQLSQKLSEYRKTKEQMDYALSELDKKESELTAKKDEILSKQSELQTKERDALVLQKELLEKKKKAEDIRSDLVAALQEANLKEAELLAKQAEVIATKTSLEQQKEELQTSIEQLNEAKTGLQEIDAALLKAKEAYAALTSEDLIRAVTVLRKIYSKIKIATLSTSAQKMLDFIELCKKYGIEIDIDRPMSEAAEKLVVWMEQINWDYFILSDPEAPVLVRKAIDGDQTVIHSEAYANIRKAASHYCSDKLSEESFQTALTDVTELYDMMQENSLYDIDYGFNELASRPFDDFLSELKTIKTYANTLTSRTGYQISTVGDLVREYDRYQKQSGAISDEHKNLLTVLRATDGTLPLSDLVSRADGISEFISTWISYDNLFENSVPLMEGMQKLLAVANHVTEDWELLNQDDVLTLIRTGSSAAPGSDTAAAYQNLKEALSRYSSEVISEETYHRALHRCSILNDLIEQYDLLNFMKTIAAFSSWTYRDALMQLSKMTDYAKQLEAETGDPITTIGDFTNAYDDAVVSLSNTITELKTKRKTIIDQLAKKGITEDGIDEAIQKAQDGIVEIDKGIEKADEGLKEIQEGLDFIYAKRSEANEAIAQIDDGLRQINDGLSQIDEGLNEINGYYEQIRTGLVEIDDGMITVQNAKTTLLSELSSAEKLISNAKSQLEKKRKEVDDEWAKTLLEFADVEEEIENARNEIEDFKGYQDLCNQFLLYFSDNADPSAVLATVNTKLNDVEIKDSYVYDDSRVKKRIEANLVPIKELSYFIPSAFFVVIMIVTFLFMSLIVRQCRREIGILRALGFTRESIRSMFSFIGLGVSGSSFLPGLLIGWILTVLIGRYFKSFFSLPFCLYQFDWKMVLLTFILTIFVVQIATFAGTALINHVQPTEAMTRNVPSDLHVPGFIHKLINKVPELVKFNLLTLLRNKTRFVLTIVCIAATSTMIFSSISFIASKNHILKQTFDDRIHYDAQIYFSKPVEDTLIRELNQLDYISDVQRVTFQSRNVSSGKEELSLLVSSLPANSELVGVYDDCGNTINIPERGIILDQYSADYLGVSAGDTIRVGDKDLVIQGLSDQCISRVQYVSPAQAALLGDEDLGSLILKVSVEDQQKLMEFLLEQDGYLYCVFTDVFRDSMNHLFGTYDFYAWILVVFAVTIGLVIVINIASTNLLEMKKELCILRTLGFTLQELSLSLFSQSTLHFVLSLLIGIPAGEAIARHGLNAINTVSRSYKYVSGPNELIITVVIVFFYIVIGHFVSVHEIGKWDIVENVKDKE